MEHNCLNPPPCVAYEGINAEEDLPKEFLTELYHDIKSNEIKKDCDYFTT